MLLVYYFTEACSNFYLCLGSYGMTTGRSIGSGTIIDKDGTILTCAHVVVDFQGLGSLSKGKVSDFWLPLFCQFF